jgi:hypothetical protein
MGPSTVSGNSKIPLSTSETNINVAVEHAITLTVTSPVDNSQVQTSTVAVTGKTVPNAEVSVNDKDIKANATGVFSVTISLDEGENPIMVVANDANGNAAEQEITITYIPAQ